MHGNRYRNKQCVVMIGTSIHARGGIASALRLFLRSGRVGKYHLIAVETHKDGTKLTKSTTAFKSFCRFLWILSKMRVVIVHIHGASRASFYRKAIFVVTSKIAGKIVVYHHHGAEFADFYEQECGSSRQAFIRGILRMADLLICLSPEWKEIFLRIDPKLDVFVLPNPAEMKPEVASRKKGSIRIQVLSMGHLGIRKGTYDLLESIRYLKDDGVEVRLVLCGAGPKEELIRSIRKLGLQTLVTIKGWIEGDQKERIFNETDVFALPSQNEGLPMVILEAMSYGLPIVATPVGGIPEAVVNGVNGFLIPYGDTRRLAMAIGRLVTDEALRMRMGEESRRLIVKKFERERIVDSLEKKYDEIINRKNDIRIAL